MVGGEDFRIFPNPRAYMREEGLCELRIFSSSRAYMGVPAKMGGGPQIFSKSRNLYKGKSSEFFQGLYTGRSSEFYEEKYEETHIPSYFSHNIPSYFPFIPSYF